MRLLVLCAAGSFSFEQVEQAPDADAIAVIPPPIIAMGLWLVDLGGVVAETRVEREPLDVGRHHEGEALAVRPGIVGALRQWNVIVAIVLRQEIHACSALGHVAPDVQNDFDARCEQIAVDIDRAERQAGFAQLRAHAM